MSPDPRTGSSLSDVERRVAPSLFAIAVLRDPARTGSRPVNPGSIRT
ncbi:hypothetical protein [Haloplanus rallus]|nr:hypothetical protein [Haloplanus rallus]